MAESGWINGDFTLDDGFVPKCGVWAAYTPTVTLVGGAGNTVPVYSTNSGRWSRVASMIFIEVLLDGDGGDEGAGTGVINIALPVAAGASKIVNELICGLSNNGSGQELLYGIIGQSGNTISLERQTAIRSHSALTGADQDNVARKIELNFLYEID